MTSPIHFPAMPDVRPDSSALLLAPTEHLNWSDPVVRQFVSESCPPRRQQSEPLAQAVQLFYAVRDRIRYDPYQISLQSQAFRASQVISDGYGWCVTKAALLTACYRSIGIPAGIGLADVRNHLTSEKLRARMGGVDIFYDHGYTAALINNRWLKLVPAFNIELCERFGVRPTEFDGTADALYQPFDTQNRLHMEYLKDHGVYSDVPLQKVRDDFANFYPPGLIDPSGLTKPIANGSSILPPTLADEDPFEPS